MPSPLQSSSDPFPTGEKIYSTAQTPEPAQSCRLKDTKWINSMCQFQQSLNMCWCHIPESGCAVSALKINALYLVA